MSLSPEPLISLFWSVSSRRKKKTPFVCFAKRQLTSEVNREPVCKKPVGDGANLVTIASSLSGLFGYLISKS